MSKVVKADDGTRRQQKSNTLINKGHACLVFDDVSHDLCCNLCHDCKEPLDDDQNCVLENHDADDDSVDAHHHYDRGHAHENDCVHDGIDENKTMMAQLQKYDTTRLFLLFQSRHDSMAFLLVSHLLELMEPIFLLLSLLKLLETKKKLKEVHPSQKNPL